MSDFHNMIKCVAIGDGGVGKTSLLISYTTNEFPREYIPTVFDNYAVTVLVNEQPYTLGLFDTAGQEEYQYLRMLSYPHTDVYLLCFSVMTPSSLENLSTIWLPEIRTQSPNAAIILVGTQTDRRENKSDLDQLSKHRLRPVTAAEGQKWAKRIGAISYLECSALTQKGVKCVFDTAITAALQPPEHVNCSRGKSKLGKLSGCFGISSRHD